MKICVGDTNMLVSNNAKICLTPNAKHKTCVTPNAKPNVSQRNIGCLGSPMQNFRAGHVHFSFFCVDFFRVGSCFSVKYGLKVSKLFVVRI